MSTRSGKRIHSSIEEPVVENMFQLKSERNTRSKQQKTSNVLPLTEKKRKHYVRYPSEEEITNSDNGNIEIAVKNTRKSRRHTLKEQNKIVSDCEPIIDVKAERSTRRTKKNSVKNDLDNVELTLIKEVTEEKKKGKKKKAAKVTNTEEDIENVPEVDIKINTKKKTNKKKNKKKSNSLIVTDVSENVNKKLNKSNASIDSFHSAAGSPVVNTSQNSSNNKNCVINESPKNKKTKRNVHDEESIMNVSVDTPNKRRKLTVEMKCNQTNGSVKNSPTEELLSESDKSQSSAINEVESIHNNTFDKDNSVSALNKSLDANSKRKSNKKTSCDKVNDKNTTFEIDSTNKELSSTNKLKLSDKRPSLNNTFDGSFKRDTSRSSMINGNGLNLNATFNKDNCNQSDVGKINDGINDITNSSSKKKRKSSIKNSTYDKIDEPPVTLNATFDKDILTNSSITNSVTRESKSSIDSFDQNKTESLNSTYDKNPKAKISISCFNATFDKPASLDSTFDKSLKKDSIDQSKMRPKAKSSLLSSDTTDNSLNITDDNSHVSINSDDSKLENIINTTPVLVESSMDESKTDTTDSLTDTEVINNTPRREATFTEENKTSPSHKADTRTEFKSHTPAKKNGMVLMSPKQTNLESEITPLENTTTTPKKKVLTETKLATTPLKRDGTFTKDSPDVMTHKLSKDMTPRRMSLPSPGCTPHPGSKSSLKEKSVLNVTRSIEKSRRSSLADVAPRLTRVMFCSPVNNPAVVTQMKGKIIKSNLKGSNKSFVFDESVSELSRPARKRSYTQTEAEGERSSPARSAERRARPRTASAAGRLQEAKGERRTKLPNFAALHQKQFERMESLDEWQRRRGQRARLLTTPPALARAAETDKNVSQSDSSTKKIETPKLKQPSAVPGFTKFGFKLNLDVNPFSIPSKTTDVKPKEKKAVVLKRQATLPSLAGATALRREIAKQTIMREKSFAEKKNVHRNETRTVIKGVRTNRRFELQMKMRNINN
ncbi:protein ZDS2 [Vanessa atalanta]|uniref:protein ZDS2 n=1 Tax=Vanessa atalanta TaxID=42275 RepID=UPI001FCDB341|nr:protein ZDS2 [Vanessa atalanta]